VGLLLGNRVAAATQAAAACWTPVLWSCHNAQGAATLAACTGRGAKTQPNGGQQWAVAVSAVADSLEILV
jgi:hypothetical protein